MTPKASCVTSPPSILHTPPTTPPTTPPRLREDVARVALVPDDTVAGDPGIPPIAPLTVLIVAPSLDAGAADVGAFELARTLAHAGHRPIVASTGGRLVPALEAAGAEFIAMNAARKNPAVILRNAIVFTRLVRTRGCHVIHAHGRAPAWSAWWAARRTGVPFLTSWYKGFREQNALKRFYNSVMARGDRVIAVSDQIADLINQRYATPWERISVIPLGVDIERFDPAGVAPERIDAVRRAWGIDPDIKVILVAGRMLRRKGHDVVVRAVHRLADMGIKDFRCVFVGEDAGRTRYAGELWDLVHSTDSADVIRIAGAMEDMPAVYAAATVVVSAAIQPEGLSRTVLEAQAMGRPVVVSDLCGGGDSVLAPPAVPEDRMTGLRFSSGDPVALAAALVRVFSLGEQARNAIGARGRAWVVANFNAPATVAPTLRLYANVAQRQHRA
jgi:glycosyltransferase involved in cell wall biosynthesis